MSFIEKLGAIEKRFALSFVGFIIGAAGTALAIYSEFLKDTSPNVVFEILSETNVLSLKEDVGELKLFYGDIDIKSKKQTLSVFVARIKNLGDSAVLQNYYDPSYPYSIKISGGDLIKIDAIGGSSDYLRQTARPQQLNNTQALLPKVILDKGDWYIVKGLILHNQNIQPEIKPIGKIAGMKSVGKVDLQSEKDISFLKAALGGPIQVQLFRSLVYFFGFIFSVFAIAIPFLLAGTSLEKVKRESVIRRFTKHHDDKINIDQLTIREYYLKYGSETIELILDDKIKIEEEFASKRPNPNDETFNLISLMKIDENRSYAKELIDFSKL